MAHLLGADRVTVALGTRTVLSAVSLGLDDGARIGVVGPNGAGKSTLLRLLAGLQTPDDGRVTRAGGVRVGLLDQRDTLRDGTVLDAIRPGAGASRSCGCSSASPTRCCSMNRAPRQRAGTVL